MKTRTVRWTFGVLVSLIATGLLAYRLLLHAVPIDTASVRNATVSLRITGPATVQARIPVTLSARTTSTVTDIHVDQGDAVKRGQELVRLDDRDLHAKRSAAAQATETVRRNIAAAEANIAKAQSDLELARGNYQRDHEVFKAGYVSAAAMDAAQAGMRAAEAGLANAKATLAARQSEALSIGQESRYADALLSYTRIYAPLDGIVVQRLMEVGATAVPGSPILKIVDPRSVWVAARIDESLVGRLEVGMPASIRLRTGESLSGKVARIAQQSDAATRELQVEIAFDSPPKRFAIEQEAQVSIVAGNESGLAVPASAIVHRDEKSGVLMVRDGRVHFQPVQLGLADGAQVLIKNGLAAGDQVAADPAAVKAGTRVVARVAPQN